MASRQWRRPSWLAVALVVVGVALFARLGIWQYGRAQEKYASIAAVANVVAKREALPLVQTANEGARASAYDWVEGSGAFADIDPVLLDEQIRNGRVGVRVYRVFVMENADRSVGGHLLVDVGWVPWPPDRSLPNLPFPETARMEIRGLLAPPPPYGIPLGSGIAHKDHAFLATRIDLGDMAPDILNWAPNATPPLAPRVLRLDPTLPMGFERDLEILPNAMPPERHLGYAVQWFALALAAIAIFIVLHWRKVEKST